VSVRMVDECLLALDYSTKLKRKKPYSEPSVGERIKSSFQA